MYREKLLSLLSQKYENEASIISEISNLSLKLSLPKGTEHFMSDLHGEYEAFSHICRNASGVIKRKIDALFAGEMSENERAELSTLIYYPEEKLTQSGGELANEQTVIRILRLLSMICEKYDYSTVNERITSVSPDYSSLILELIFSQDSDSSRRDNIIRTVKRLGGTAEFITALSRAVRALVIDRWHIVGDIFDRGARADIILDELRLMPSVDIEWGNHDALWLGAAAGSPVCIVTAIANSLAYGNTTILERGYGISLHLLSELSEKYYRDSDVSAFMPKTGSDTNAAYTDTRRIAEMSKAINIIRYKLEGEVIHRHPEYLMDERIMLERIDFSSGEIEIDGKKYAICDTFFPTVDKASPLKLNPDEQALLDYLTTAFSESERLKKHARFLLNVGGMYKIYNRNLMFHGCIPLNENGEFARLAVCSGLSGKALMDECERRVRAAFSGESAERDFLWFLWCGKNSPLCAREKITSFERQFISDEQTHKEKKNPYYMIWGSSELAIKILDEFSLPHHSHIINGHIPVKRGENPIKADGRLIVIDGGFSSGFHSGGAAAGYTLIYNADGMRLAAHEPFSGKEKATQENRDIHSHISVFEEKSRKILVRELDEGDNIRSSIADLLELLELYRAGKG